MADAHCEGARKVQVGFLAGFGGDSDTMQGAASLHCARGFIELARRFTLVFQRLIVGSSGGTSTRSATEKDGTGPQT